MTPTRRLSIKAVVTGFVAALVMALLLALAYVMNIDSAGLTPDEQTLRLRTDTSSLVLVLLFGLAAAVLGGYVAARVARERELAHAAATAIVWLAVSALLAIASLVQTLGGAVGPGSPAWFNVASYGLTLPSAVLGGWLAKRERERRGGT